MFSDSLNPQQLQAVKHGEGPLMVVAGAGSGKTRVITSRIVSLALERNVPTECILAITFTNKAADEMLGRVNRMLNNPSASLWISTFHSFCLRLLRRHISALGFKNDFVIYDQQDQLSLVKQCMKALHINEEVTPPKAVLSHIGGFKNDFLMPNEIDIDSLSYGHKLKAAQVYPAYQKALKENNALDFDDLLVLTVRLLEQEEPTADYYNNRFRYLLVDEFQDTNLTQYRLVRMLTRRHKNVCVVGDDDQSIYRWRGANIGNILNFERDYPGVVVIKLEENYRSTQNILKAAGAVVRQNANRKEKTLWTRNAEGAPVYYIQAEDEIDEARSVREHIERLNREDKVPFSEMAVLYRTNAQSRVVEDMLRERNLPYQVVGGLRFYERKEIKDIVAYMRVALNPSDSVALRRIVNVPARGIGKTSVDKIESYCAGQRLPLLEGMRQAEARHLASAAVGKKISAFVALMDCLYLSSQNKPAQEFLTDIFERTGYLRELEDEKTQESRGRTENLKELRSAIDQFTEKGGKTLNDFLDTVTLAADIDQLDDTQGILRLMTLHSCKGLEFEVVFIVGMENKLLPHASSMESQEEYEEERRLCYVGFTRARKKLFLTNARRRRIYGSQSFNNPSDFLSAIPGEIVEPIASAGVGRAASSYETSSYTPKSSARVADNMDGGSDIPPPTYAKIPAKVPYPIGAKVIHSSFGPGIVVNREGEDSDLKVDVFFKGLGQKKKLAVNYAKLIVL